MAATLPVSPLDELMQQALDHVERTPRPRIERRAAPRVACAVEVYARVDDAPSKGTTLDLSPGGAALILPRGVQIGQVLDLRFQPPGFDFEVACAGLVRSVSGPATERRLGVEFHNLAPAARRSLAEWVRARITEGLSSSPTVHRPELGTAARVEGLPTRLRWAVPFASMWSELARLLASSTSVFVPSGEDAICEGDRVVLEIVPPSGHSVLQLQAEVTWVGNEGFALKHGGLTDIDRVVVASITAHFVRESARYR